LLVSYRWLVDHYNDADIVILDSRGNTEYSYSHIPNSHPLGIEKMLQSNSDGITPVIDSDTAASLFGSLGIDDSKTVIICGDSMDPAAARIAWTLLYFGHTKTKILDMSMVTWQNNGFPTTKEIANSVQTTFIPNVNAEIRIKAESLRKKIDDAVIIDARSPQEFLAGRIPNATLFPFTDGVGENGMLFKEKDDLSHIFREQQIPTDRELICYCTLGHRAANLFTQLKIAGYENVKLYDGSFADWISKGFPLA
jgi:thiosulfate/3-mercaptopyruvate sulfurtransferase